MSSSLHGSLRNEAHVIVCQEPPHKARSNGRCGTCEEQVGRRAERAITDDWDRHSQEPGKRDLGKLQGCRFWILIVTAPPRCRSATIVGSTAAHCRSAIVGTSGIVKTSSRNAGSFMSVYMTKNMTNTMATIIAASNTNVSLITPLT